MEMKIAVQNLGLPVMTFEGNMADEREFDEGRTTRFIDLLVTETLGLKIDLFITETLRLKKVAD
jgi:benzoyl-CoA reductase subunit B